MSDPLPMFHASKVRRCVKCDGTRWRMSARSQLICADCEKTKGRARKARNRGEVDA